MLPLNDKEQEMMELVCRGKSNADIAEVFGLSKPTIQGCLRVIYPKLDAKNRAEAAAHYAKLSNTRKP